MKCLHLLGLSALLFAMGCGSSETPEPSSDAAAMPDSGPALTENGAATPAPQPSGSQMSQAFSAVAADIAANNYDAAAGKLALLKHAPKTPEEERQFVQLNDDLNRLLMLNAQGDPAAQRPTRIMGE